MLQDHTTYHVERARAELHMAYSAASHVAAQAHMKLSALHMRNLQRMDEACRGSECRPPRQDTRPKT